MLTVEAITLTCNDRVQQAKANIGHFANYCTIEPYWCFANCEKVMLAAATHMVYSHILHHIKENNLIDSSVPSLLEQIRVQLCKTYTEFGSDPKPIKGYMCHATGSVWEEAYQTINDGEQNG